MNYANWLGISFFSFLISYKGYYYCKKKINEYIMEKVNEELNKKMENEEEVFKLFHKNSSAVLKITQGGKTHPIYLPYDRRKSTSMLRKKVFLIKGEEKKEISQKPGIPYLVSANMLGGDSINIEDFDGNIIHTYSGEEIPNCF